MHRSAATIVSRDVALAADETIGLSRVSANRSTPAAQSAGEPHSDPMRTERRSQDTLRARYTPHGLAVCTRRYGVSTRRYGVSTRRYGVRVPEAPERHDFRMRIHSACRYIAASGSYSGLSSRSDRTMPMVRRAHARVGGAPASAGGTRASRMNRQLACSQAHETTHAGRGCALL